MSVLIKRKKENKMKNRIILTVLISIFVSQFAYADPVGAVKSIGNYIIQIAQAGIIIPVAMSAIHFKMNNHDKAWHWVKGAALAAVVAFGASSIVGTLQSFAR